MKKLLVALFIIAILATACGTSNPTALPESTALAAPTSVITPTITPISEITPTSTSVAEEEWKIIKSIASEDNPILQENFTNNWSEFLLERAVFFQAGFKLG